MRRLSLVLLALLLLLAACGGDDKSTKTQDGSGTTSSTGAPESSTTTAPPSTETSTTSTTAVGPTTTGATTSSTVAAMPTEPSKALGEGDTSVYVIGDSVLLGTKAELPVALAGWDLTLDAEGSRRLTQAIPVLADKAADARVVVVHMGNNYIPNEASPGGATTYAEQIDEAMDVLADVDRVVWVTVAEVSDSRRSINADIRAAADEYDNLVVADWAKIVNANAQSDEIAGDALHLGHAGRAAISELIALAIGPAPES